MSCPECFTGSLHAGAPTGTEKQLGGLSTYVATPPSKPVGTIIYLTDVFGWTLPNSRLLADAFAREGYKVYIPDLFPYQPIKPEEMREEFTSKFDELTFKFAIYSRAIPFLFRVRKSVTLPKIIGFARAVQVEEGGSKLFSVGYCFGGRYSVILSTPAGQGLFAANVAMHPSQISVPGEVQGATVPLSIGVGTEDNAVPKKTADTIAGLLKSAGVDYEIKWYEGMKHGFAVRGDLSNEKERAPILEAKQQTLNWFNKYL